MFECNYAYSRAIRSFESKRTYFKVVCLQLSTFDDSKTIWIEKNLIKSWLSASSTFENFEGHLRLVRVERHI